MGLITQNKRFRALDSFSNETLGIVFEINDGVLLAEVLENLTS